MRSHRRRAFDDVHHGNGVFDPGGAEQGAEVSGRDIQCDAGSVNHPRHALGDARDFAFGRHVMEARRARGRADAETTLRASPWLPPMPPRVGARVFGVLAGGPEAG